MGRHDIRLRRKRMTSRRIESHKNYYEVMRRHQKTSRLKKVFKLLILLIFFLALIFFSYSLLTKVSEADQSQEENTSYRVKIKTEQQV
ncbi:MAG: hypothetical protein ABJH05_13080 [Fulvivirga sp.]